MTCWTSVRPVVTSLISPDTPCVMMFVLWIMSALSLINVSEPVEFVIGALLSNEKVASSFEKLVNSVSESIGDEVIQFKARAEILSLNALKATEQVCNLFNSTDGRMLTLIVSHPSGAPGVAPLSVSFTSSFYFLPTIGVSARQAVFSDKYIHASFLRTVPPYSLEGRIWADLITVFGWREVCLIHSDDQDAKALISSLEIASVKVSTGEKLYKITRQVVINTDEEIAARTRDFVSLLRPVRDEQTRAIFVFLRRSFAEHVFAAARKLGMLEAEWAWIVTEPALQASNIPQGVIGVRLLQSGELDHVNDAIRVATSGILSMARAFPKQISVLRSVKTCTEDPLEIQSEPSDGGQTYRWNQYAIHLYEHMLRVNLSDGRTGQVEFDRKGDRVRPIYEIVNAQLLDPQGALFTQPLDKAFEFKRPDLVSVGRYGVPQPTPLEWTSDIPYPTMLSINMSALIWPGNSMVQRNQMVCVQKDTAGICQKTEKRLISAAPISFKKKRHLRVVTVHSIPFIYHRLKPPGTKCNESDDPLAPKMEVECKHTDPVTGNVTVYCCYGYCVDLLRHLSNRTKSELSSTVFTYDLHLVGDGQIGEEVEKNETRQWTGIMGEILSGMADLAVAPVSITPERAARVEFSKPFKYLGITILVKRERPKSNLGSFLQPFETTLWVLVALSVHAVAWVLYLLDRFSPFGQYRTSANTKKIYPKRKNKCIDTYPQSTENLCTRDTNTLESQRSDSRSPAADEAKTCLIPVASTSSSSPSETNEEGLSLSLALYFAWGVLLNSGIGEGTPRSFSARVLGMVWAGFAMIIVASYTANLAAFLVLDRPESSISGIDDMRLRNSQKDFTFATVRGSPVEQYFMRQMEYSTLYRTMESNNYDSIDEAIQAVRKGTLKAFIWDSARLNYEAAMDCDLITAGEVFGRMSYGLVMKKDSPWLHELSQAVLNFHERGYMETLDSRWIHVRGDNCERTETSPATLGLTNMAGVFIMVAAGILTGLPISMAEIACRKRRRMEERQSVVATAAIRRWRENVHIRRLQQTNKLKGVVNSG